MRVFSSSEILAWIIGLGAIELCHLKWIWLSEWSCRKCARKNLECDCPGRWQKYL
jgi:hypothetical protein